ncbi:hypothetical protein ACN27G_32710 [Plantactinospora sp. WMMB334]|uniref:hypothetical protein n=1 Tax=Plantactinospora sp. WMMB334 TaxID=3404119 RepID=UPI003B94CD59
MTSEPDRRLWAGDGSVYGTLFRGLLLWAPLAAVVASAWTGHRAYPVGLLLGGLVVWGGAVAVRRRLPLVPLFAVVLLCVLDGNFCLGLPLVSYLLGRRTARIWPAAVSFSALAVLGTPLVLSWSGFVPWVTMAGALVYAGLFRGWSADTGDSSAHWSRPVGSRPSSSNANNGCWPARYGSVSGPGSPRTCTTRSVTS